MYACESVLKKTWNNKGVSHLLIASLLIFLESQFLQQIYKQLMIEVQYFYTENRFQ